MMFDNLAYLVMTPDFADEIFKPKLFAFYVEFFLMTKIK